MNKNILRGLNRIKEALAYRVVLRNNRKYINQLRSTCPEIKRLSREQKDLIQSYYKKFYGKRLYDYRWHEYYYSRNGIFSEKYIPNYVLYNINRTLFNRSISTAFDDKNLYYTLFPDITMPKAFLRCVNGHYYLGMETSTQREALEACGEIGECIIKPTYCSCNGDGVKHLDIHGGVDSRSQRSIEEIVKGYGKNFVIQEAIHQHENLARLNPSSVNTIRIVTYRQEDDVEVIYAVMRIGKFGSEVDNTSAGGMTCLISEEGKLSKKALCSKPAGDFEENEAGVKFEGFQIPSFPEVVRKAKEMHFRMPHFIMIGWDFTVNEKGDVVFVEMNAPFGLHQPAAGPGYGRFTDEILLLYKEISSRR